MKPVQRKTKVQSQDGRKSLFCSSTTVICQIVCPCVRGDDGSSSPNRAVKDEEEDLTEWWRGSSSQLLYISHTHTHTLSLYLSFSLECCCCLKMMRRRNQASKTAKVLVQFLTCSYTLFSSAEEACYKQCRSVW